LIRERIRESVSPRQSPSSSILASISRDGDSPLCEASFFLFFFMSLSPGLIFLSCEGSDNLDMDMGPRPRSPTMAAQKPFGNPSRATPSGEDGVVRTRTDKRETPAAARRRPSGTPSE